MSSSSSSCSSGVQSPSLLVGMFGDNPLYAALICPADASSSSSGSSASVAANTHCDCPYSIPGISHSFTIHLSGFQNSSCDKCANIDGDYQLIYTGYDVGTDSCVFTASAFSGVFCPGVSMTLTLRVFSDSMTLTLSGAIGSDIVWQSGNYVFTRTYLRRTTDDPSECVVPRIVDIDPDYDIPAGNCGRSGFNTLAKIIGEDGKKVLFAGGKCATGGGSASSSSGGSSSSLGTNTIPIGSYQFARLIGPRPTGTYDDFGNEIVQPLYAVFCCVPVASSASSGGSSSASASLSSSGSSSVSASQSSSSSGVSASAIGSSSSSSVPASISSSAGPTTTVSCCGTTPIPQTLYATFSGTLAAIGTLTIVWDGTKWNFSGSAACGLTGFSFRCIGGTTWVIGVTGSLTIGSSATSVTCSPFSATVTSTALSGPCGSGAFTVTIVG